MLKRRANTFLQLHHVLPSPQIRFATLDELEERQYPLMDLSTMVGALGGSLGMLLGFSCLDAVRSCLNAWEKLVYTDSLN